MRALNLTLVFSAFPYEYVKRKTQVFHTWPNILTFGTLNKDQPAKGGLIVEGTVKSRAVDRSTIQF